MITRIGRVVINMEVDIRCHWTARVGVQLENWRVITKKKNQRMFNTMHDGTADA